LNGRWFHDLKEHVDGRLADSSRRADSFPALHSCSRLAEEPKREDTLAVVSCMPPSQTGIATCTLLTFRDAGYPVDIFSSYATTHEYLLGISDIRLRGSPIRVFDASTLPLARSQGEYRGQLFVVGNSHHNAAITVQLRQGRHFPSSTPLHLYIHDPCLLNLCFRVSRAENTDFRKTLCASYGLSMNRSFDFEDLVTDKICGVRPLFSDVKVSSVIVNSKAAADMITTELPNVPVHVMFHPILPVHVASPIKRVPGNFRIGSFGLANKFKQTELVTAAFQTIRKTIPNSTLVLAGFEVGPYATAHGLRPEDGYEVYDSPDDEQFDALLDSVDVAVQLRRDNLGESSGPIARLLAIGKPVVVSNVGSFAELGQAVRLIDSNRCTATELADIIVQERSQSQDRRTAIEEYRKVRSTEAFCRKLEEIIPARSMARLMEAS
jgi:glycosyltransferase involved in cell wall biosynthesis